MKVQASNLNFRILIPVACIAVLDLIIKTWVVSTIGFQKELKLVEDTFSIIAIKNMRMAFGFRDSTQFLLFEGIDIIFKLLFLFVFARIQTRDVAKGFKWAAAMIVFGWVGNLADRLIFSEEGDNGSYLHMDYFYDALATNAVTSITTMMIMIGWVLLVIMVLVRNKDVRKIFVRSKSVTA
jgi:lipoprotein signal peptidase